jgi:hypothetical protein
VVVRRGVGGIRALFVITRTGVTLGVGFGIIARLALVQQRDMGAVGLGIVGEAVIARPLLARPSPFMPPA